MGQVQLIEYHERQLCLNYVPYVQTSAISKATISSLSTLQYVFIEMTQTLPM